VENCRGYHNAPIAREFFRAKIGRIQELIQTAPIQWGRFFMGPLIGFKLQGFIVDKSAKNSVSKDMLDSFEIFDINFFFF
jgi:hypothetical protein